MSSKEERKAEEVVKSSHKKEKKRKSIISNNIVREASPSVVVAEGAAAVNGTNGLEVNGKGSSTSGEEDKKAKKERKAEKKRLRKEAEQKSSSEVTSIRAEEPPMKRAKTIEDSDSLSKEEKKAAKKRAKEENKVAKGLHASTSSSALEKASTPSTTSNAASAAAARAYMEENSITIEALEASEEKPPFPMLSFGELKGKIDERLERELERNKFTKPTPIQACCWSVLLANLDVVGIAETGSGKTIAFGLPALQHVLNHPAPTSMSSFKGKGKTQPNVNVLIIAPTRELAIQTHVTMEKLANALGFGSICLYGGVSKYDQIQQLSSSPSIRVVVGTPGRVLDLAREGTLDLSHVSYAVLDEADRMLDVGFEPDIRAILEMTQSKEKGRHTSMFSATWPMSLRGLAETFMKNPMRVTIGSDELSANHRVEQSVEVLEDGRAKERRLEAFLRKIGAGPKGKSPNDKVLIFALYKKEAQRVEETLRRNGYKVAGIHGDLSQVQRIASLDAFKSGQAPLLVATDVAARGIDVPLVEYVVNYTFPLTIEDYVHRIGRTGRAGRSGKSITFFTQEDKSHAGELIRILKDSNQPLPEAMMQFPTTIKRKEHSAYGAHFKELVPGKAKKITFD